MKLLLDHNLPPSLASAWRICFRTRSMFIPLDWIEQTIWKFDEYARQNGFMIVTKDVDFSDLCVLRGFPPKIIWIRRGNCSITAIEKILRDHYQDVEALDLDPMNGVLTLF